jgi:hypothetical protein
VHLLLPPTVSLKIVGSMYSRGVIQPKVERPLLTLAALPREMRAATTAVLAVLPEITVKMSLSLMI